MGELVAASEMAEALQRPQSMKVSCSFLTLGVRIRTGYQALGCVKLSSLRRKAIT